MNQRITKAEAEARVDEIVSLHLTWKPGITLDVAKAIARKAIASDSFWPDEICYPEIPIESRNCIGSAFRLLVRYFVITKTGCFKTSERLSNGGRTIFQYRLESTTIASAFLTSNQPDSTPAQTELGI